MSIQPWLLATHLLGVVAWVGGMLFAVVILRPSLSVLEPPQRSALHGQLFARFFRLVWHAMPLVLLTGYAMLFGVYGGLRHVAWPVHVMHLTGLVMAALFAFIFFGPWKAMRAATAQGDRPAAASAGDRIRRLVNVNLGLGLLTVAVAAFA